MFKMDILYKKNTNPLERVDKLEYGKVYFTREGQGIMFLSDCEIELINGSPLVEGETIDGLTEKQLNLFWTIVRNTTPKLQEV